MALLRKVMIIIKKILKYIIDKLYYLLLVMMNIFIMYLCANINLFTALITIDGASTMIDFVKNHSDKKLSDSQVIKINGNMYKAGTIERYTYYMGTSMIYLFLTNLVFNCDLIIMRYIIGITLLPTIFNNIICGCLDPLFDKIIKERNDLIKKIFCTQTANIIMQLKKMYFGNSTVIDKQEIILALENLENIKTELLTFGKKFVLVAVLIYLRNSYMIPYKFIKWILVKFVYGENIRQMTYEEAKELFERVINNKQYDQITKPMFIQSMIYLFNIRGETGGFKKYLKKFTYKITAMFALLATGSLSPILFGDESYTMIIILSLSTVLIFTRKIPLGKNIVLSYLFKNKNNNNILKYLDDRTIISTILTALIGIHSNNAFLLSFVNQFSGILLFNILMFNLIKVIYVNTYSKITSFISDMHSNNLTIIKYMSIVIMYKVGKLTQWHDDIPYILPIIIHFMSKSKMFKYLYPLLYIGLVNNDNYIKLVALSYILSTTDNLIIKRYSSIFMIRITTHPILKIDTDREVRIFDKKTVINHNYFDKNNIKTAITKSIRARNNITAKQSSDNSPLSTLILPNKNIDYTTPLQHIDSAKNKLSEIPQNNHLQMIDQGLLTHEVIPEIEIDYTKPVSKIKKSKNKLSKSLYLDRKTSLQDSYVIVK